MTADATKDAKDVNGTSLCESKHCFKKGKCDTEIRLNGSNAPYCQVSRSKHGKAAAKSQKSSGSLFRHVRTFVVCLSLLQLVQVMGSGYSKSALTSIERRYRLTTFQMGMLQSCFHIGNLSVILFVSYFGSKWHRPRTIAIGSTLMALSSLLSAMPQFVGERYMVNSLTPVVVATPSVRADAFGLESPPQINLPGYSTRNGDAATSDEVVIHPNVTALDVRNSSGFFDKLSEMVSNSTIKQLESDLFVWRNRRRPGANDSDAISASQAAFFRKASHESPSAANDGEDRSADDMFPRYLCKSKSTSLPDPRMLQTTESDSDTNDTFLYLFIAAGSILKGMGHSPLHPLGMSFIDDFALPSNSAVYIGVVSALSLLGPALGFILGSLTTNVWVDIGWTSAANITVEPHHSAWVGAWWIGYVVTGCLLLVVTLPFCLFPRVIDDEERRDSSNWCFSWVERYFSDEESVSSLDEKETQIESDTENEDLFGDSGDCSGSGGGSGLFPTVTRPMNNARSFGDLRRGVLSREDFSSHQLRPPKKGRDRLVAISETNESGVTQTIRLLQQTCNRGDMRTNSIGENYLRTPEMRFLRSASAPTIHSLYRSRIPRAYSFAPAECLISKKFLKKTIRSKDPQTDSKSMKGFFMSLKNLLRDPVFMSICLGFVCLTSFLATSITYVSKYMEAQFGLTASSANLLNGCVNLPMAVVGNILGGWIIRRRNLNVKRTITVVLLSLVMTAGAVVLLLFCGCEDRRVNSTGSCLSSCDCDGIDFPVCDVTTNTTYRSPCHVGCTRMKLHDDEKIFFDCHCLQGGMNASASEASSAFVRAGACTDPNCYRPVSIFVALMGIASMSAGMSSTPSTLTILRVVPPSDKAFAIGLVFVFTRILAWIPAPVYVGFAIDTACLDGNSSNGSGSRVCRVYDKGRLRSSLFGIAVFQLMLACLFYALSLYLVTRRHKARGKLQHGSCKSKA